MCRDRSTSKIPLQWRGFCDVQVREYDRFLFILPEITGEFIFVRSADTDDKEFHHRQLISRFSLVSQNGTEVRADFLAYSQPKRGPYTCRPC